MEKLVHMRIKQLQKLNMEANYKGDTRETNEINKMTDK